ATRRGWRADTFAAPRINLAGETIARPMYLRGAFVAAGPILNPPSHDPSCSSESALHAALGSTDFPARAPRLTEGGADFAAAVGGVSDGGAGCVLRRAHRIFPVAGARFARGLSAGGRRAAGRTPTAGTCRAVSGRLPGVGRHAGAGSLCGAA